MPPERRQKHLNGARHKRAGRAQQLHDDIAEALRVAALPTNDERRARIERIAQRDGEARAQLIRSAAWIALHAGL